MIRGLTLSEQIDLLPPLSDKEEEALSKVEIEKILAQIPPMEYKPWKVVDAWGNTIKRYASKEEALESAIERNIRAQEFGVWMRYSTQRDQGFQE